MEDARTTANRDTFLLIGAFRTELRRRPNVARDSFRLLNTISVATAETPFALCRVWAVCF